MLSYQHSYHAGGPADVHKHAALSVLLEAFKKHNSSLITYAETHAGRGQYQLQSKEALKTGEAKTGILTIAPSLIRKNAPAYAHCLESHRKRHGTQSYPGSPALARMLLTAEDQLHFAELHPQEFSALASKFRAPNTHLSMRDGYDTIYEVATNVSKLANHKGLILIDPSYEIKSEYELVVDFIIAVHEIWPEATILLWYPMLESGLYKSMIDELREQTFQGFWVQEILFKRPKHRALGSGLCAINLPKEMEAALSLIANLF